MDTTIGIDTMIAIIVALVAIGGLIISHRTLKEQIKEQNNTKYLDTLQSYSDKLVSLYKEADKVETADACITWIYDYLEPCDVIVYAEKHGQFPPIIEYFHDGWFSLGHTLMIWYDELRNSNENLEMQNLRPAVETWTEFAVYCRDKNIKVEPYELPEKLIEVVPNLEKNITSKSCLNFSNV